MTCPTIKFQIDLKLPGSVDLCNVFVWVNNYFKHVTWGDWAYGLVALSFSLSPNWLIIPNLPNKIWVVHCQNKSKDKESKMESHHKPSGIKANMVVACFTWQIFRFTTITRMKDLQFVSHFSLTCNSCFSVSYVCTYNVINRYWVFICKCVCVK